MSKAWLFSASLLVLTGVNPALAGFQWVPPATQEQAPQIQMQAPVAPVQEPEIVMAPQPMTSSLPESLAKMPDNEPQAQAQPVVTEMAADPGIQWPTVVAPDKGQAMATPSVAPVNNAPVPLQAQAEPQILMPEQDRMAAVPNMAPIESAPLTTASSQFDVIQGFGRDLPMVMAVRQIIPEGYGYAFAESTPLNATVSWEGGRPWDQVLYEVLSPLGYKASISGTQVMIMPQSATALTAQATYVDRDPIPAAKPQMTTQSTYQSQGFELVAPNVARATPMSAAEMSGPSSLMQPVAYQSNTSTSSTWVADRNMTLRQILEQWSNRAGVEMYWSSEFDYPVSSAINIQGTFEQAVQTLLKGFEDAKPKPLGRLHPNLPNGPAVLVIETRQVLD